jgi:2-aminoethylphosphonate-pyruvate transaminase
MDDEIPYLLLTPGPLTTSQTVKQAMLRDYCTWDNHYHEIVQDIRCRLVRLAGGDQRHTVVLMQGSGTFSVEATIGSVIPPHGKLLVVDNGAYGHRILQIARRLRIPCQAIRQIETRPADPRQVIEALRSDPAITHVAMVHCETTTGLLNPAEEIGAVCRRYGKSFVLDAMSSFGGIPMTLDDLGADYLISSANKCIQGVPGFGFVVADREKLQQTAGWARSLSLDLYDQWYEMEQNGGKWRYTSPTHVVRAFVQALNELEAEGGVAIRHRRYCENQRLLVEGLADAGIHALVPRDVQSPIITAFLYPDHAVFTFESFYQALKARRYVIYPGKVSQADTFRIGTIGHVFPEDIRDLLRQICQVLQMLGHAI